MENIIANPQSKAAPQAQEQAFRFLDLPPELRNLIYKFARVEAKGTFIDITPNLKPPALLSASKQIREECRKIWYLNNVFTTPRYDQNRSLLNAFEEKLGYNVGRYICLRFVLPGI